MIRPGRMHVAIRRAADCTVFAGCAPPGAGATGWRGGGVRGFIRNLQQCEIILVEAIDDPVGMGGDPRVGVDADIDLVVIAEQADAQAHPSRLRHPEHHAIHFAARKVEGFTRAGHIGHDRGDTFREHIHHRILQFQRGVTQRFQQPEK